MPFPDEYSNLQKIETCPEERDLEGELDDHENRIANLESSSDSEYRTKFRIS